MYSLLQFLASSTTDIEGEINSFSIKTIGIASLVLVVLLGVASQVVNREKLHYIKKPLFMLIAATIILPSLLLIGSTVYVNSISESKGPVHWHTDIEFWACGQELELRDPYEFLSNKIGTSTYHEHDDKRIHLEGVVIEKEYDASLEKFLDVTGGDITDNSLVVPVNKDPIENDIDGDESEGAGEIQSFISRVDGEEELYTFSAKNGDSCGDGQTAEVQAFLFRLNDNENTYTQTKLTDPASYIMRDESVVPPGDCVIVEFEPAKQFTERLCQQYGVRDSERCAEFGVTELKLCNLTQVRSDEPMDEALENNDSSPSSSEAICLFDPSLPEGEQQICNDTPTAEETELPPTEEQPTEGSEPTFEIIDEGGEQ